MNVSKHFAPVSVAALFLICQSCAALGAEPSVEGDVLEFSAVDLDGNLVTHEDERFKNKVVLVDLWGTWCPPCRESIPKLIELQEEYEDEGLVVVGVAFEETEVTELRRKALREFVKANQINYLVLDGGMTSAVEGIFPTLRDFRGFPTIVIIGRDGKVTHANTVFVPRENKKIRKEVEAALGIAPETPSNDAINRDLERSTQ